jgi:hypothetical protein
MSPPMPASALPPILAIVLLNAALVLGDFLETRWAFVPAQLSIELVGFLALAALLGARAAHPRAWILVAAGTVLSLLLVLRLADIVVPWYFGREFNAVADLPYVPFGLGLMRNTLSGLAFAMILVAGALALIALVAFMCGLLAVAWRAGVERRIAPLAITAGAAAVAFMLVPARYDLGPAPVAASVARATLGNTARALDAWGFTGGNLALVQSAIAARPPAGRLDGLGGRNVLLVFVESYGSITFTDAEFRAALAPVRARWAAELPRAGYGVVSDVINAPITGGGSWMAHASVTFGVRVDTQPLFDVLLTTRARALGQDFRASGYRTVAAQPRMRQPWLQADFFGFDAVIDDQALGYRGPGYAWETIPDQFVLEEVHRRELAAGDGKPRFVMYVLASSHTPFERVPPLVADPRTLGRGEIYHRLPVAEFPPPAGNVFENRAGYVATIGYTLDALGAYLRDRLADDTLVIVLGDHQPPLNVAAATRNKAVPVHVISRDPALLAPFRARGFVDGVEPARFSTEKGMESFLADFLAAFGERRG